MRIPEGRREARIRVTRIELALHETVGELLEEANYQITYAELHLAMANMQKIWAEAELRMETPGEDEFVHVGKEHAKAIWEAAVWSVPDEKRLGVDKQEMFEDYGPDFETWWEQHSG